MSLFPLVAVSPTVRPRRRADPPRLHAHPRPAADVLVVEASSAMDDEVRDALAQGRGVVVLGAPTRALAGVTAGEDAATGTSGPPSASSATRRSARTCSRASTSVPSAPPARWPCRPRPVRCSPPAGCRWPPPRPLGPACRRAGRRPDAASAAGAVVRRARAQRRLPRRAAPGAPRRPSPPTTRSSDSDAWRGAQGRGHRPAGAAGRRRLRAGGRRPRGRRSPGRPRRRRHRGPRAAAPARRRLPRRARHGLRPLGRRRLRRAGLPATRCVAFQPQQHRVDGLQHLVVFPMYTQNGSTDRHVEAVLIEVIWPEFIADLEAGDYSNKLFVPIRFLDFTAGLRHQLRRAVPRDRRDARDPDVHLGRDLRRPRGGPLPPRRARRRRDHHAGSCPPDAARAARGPGARPRRPS